MDILGFKTTVNWLKLNKAPVNIAFLIFYIIVYSEYK
jgi:hypothetical protein